MTDEKKKLLDAALAGDIKACEEIVENGFDGLTDAEAFKWAIEMDGDDEAVCRKCGEGYDCPPECVPSPLCDTCAQEASALIPALVDKNEVLVAACKLALSDIEASSQPRLPNGRARKQWDKAFVADSLRKAIKEAGMP